MIGGHKTKNRYHKRIAEKNAFEADMKEVDKEHKTVLKNIGKGIVRLSRG